MKALTLSAVNQGIQRLREKGSADPKTLYDLENGYVAIDGSVKQRPGTELAFSLPAGTLGLCAHDGELVVFSTSPKACPAGTRCEVITHPFFPSQGLTYIHYAAPFLGYLYVVGEFENGDVYHYWLQAANQWEASTKYDEGQIIVPSTPNGLGYKAHRVLPKYPTWVPGMEVTLGDKIEPTTANGYYYEATETSEADGVGTPGGSPNPDPPDNPPGDGGGGGGGELPDIGELFSVSGNFPDGYVGSCYILVNGQDPFVASGGYWDANVYGEVLPGVGADGGPPLTEQFRTIGTPMAAGTYTTNLDFDATAPWPGGSGTASVAQSVTIAAKPTYSLPDWRFRQEFGNKLPDTTPPWTTLEMLGVSSDGMVSIGAVNTGKVKQEIITDCPIYIGINARHGAASAAMIGATAITPAVPNTVAHAVVPGTYAIELDADTGDWQVLNSAAAVIASGTLPLPSGNLYRFAWYSETIQSGTVKMNAGNEAFAVTTTVGYSGIPFGSVVVPCGWRNASPLDGASLSGGTFLGPNIASRKRDGQSHHVFGSQGNSSGKWRVQLTSTNTRVGLAVGTYTYAGGLLLGQAGAADSIGWDGSTLHWCFGGVHGEIALAVSAGASLVYAIDFTASEFKLCKVETDGTTVTVLHTLTGVPAGTWYPCSSGGGRTTRLTYNPPGPATFNDWAVTV